ncbi:MAG: GumC family protein [Thermodesulfobacteriota bacterium]
MDNKLKEYRNTDLVPRGSNQLSTDFDPYYQNYDSNSFDDINLKEYLDILIRRKWVVISCFLIFIVATAVSTIMQTPLYKSYATMEISPNTPQIVSFNGVVDFGTNSWDTESFYETQFKLIQSRTFGKRVVDSLGLSVPKKKTEKNESAGFFPFLKANVNEILFGKELKNDAKNEKAINDKLLEEEKNALATSFISGLEIFKSKDSDIVNVSYVSADPQFAAKSANTVIDEYIKYIIDRKSSANQQAREFLESQLDQAKANLEKTEETLGAFAKSVNIVSLNENLNLVYTQLEGLNKAFSEAETEKLSKQALYNQIQSGNFEYLPQVINDESMAEVRTQYTELKSEYDNLAVVFGPNYPELKQLGAKIKRVESEMKERVGGVAKSIKTDFEASLKKEEILRARTNEQNQRASELNDKAIQYKIFEREVETNKSIYESLLQRLKETEVTSANDITNVQVVDYATSPQSPFKPNMKKNLLQATIFGLMLGCFLAFVLNYFDNTIKDEDEVKNKFPVPFLGSIPLSFDSNSILNVEKAVFTDPKSQISEAFRVVRTSLLYSSPDRPPKSILVTSTQPLEGKTTSATNIALAMVQSGNKVLIIDSDLRKPRLHKVFTINGNGSENGNNFGLSSYLIGEISIESVIRKTEIEGLDFLPSGPIPPNPAELVGSIRMKELVELLEKNYDQIILDGAPIAGFADSRLLSRLVDGVLIVTSVGITQKNILKNSIEEIRKVRGKIVGTVVNRLESRRGRYGYNYYYYYSNEDDKPKENQVLRPPGA